MPVEEGGELNLEDGEPNYTSFTIWDDKSGFDEWRKGDAFKEAHKQSVEEFETVLTDACDLSATILAYNVLIHQFPKKSQNDRRQSLKDLRKKLKAKIGKSYSMPSQVSDRLQQAVMATDKK